MELKCSANTHFIQAIKGGMVRKVPNVLNGSPALVSKTLLDVYKSEDAKKLGKPPKINSHNNKHKIVESFAHVDDDLDRDFVETATLKHLIKERFLMNKRKFSHSGENSIQVYADEMVVQDESDLNEPLINWKLKRPKNSKAKRNIMNQSVGSSSLTVFDIKSEQGLVSESSLEVGAEFFHQNFVANEISYDHIEYVEPITILVPWDGVSNELDTAESICPEFLDLSPLALEMSKEIMEDHSCRRSYSGLQVPDNSINSTEEQKLLPWKFDNVNMNGSNGAKDMDYELMNKTCDSVDTLSSPEPCQPIGRILSKRKIIAPCPQERLRLAMNSFEICNDVDQYKCQGKFYGNQTGKKAEITDSHGGGPRQIDRKFIMSPKHTIKKSQNAKGNLKGPRFSCSRPNLSTGCISKQGCSESAIAFSQRQMHDMEALAVKLINELNSMKDIVKEKLLSKAYHSGSLKNNADEVKSAIKNATKVEQTAQKWLTMMSRDCKRFCKIMGSTPKSVVGAKEAVVKEEKKKKIMFADEERNVVWFRSRAERGEHIYLTGKLILLPCSKLSKKKLPPPVALKPKNKNKFHKKRWLEKSTSLDLSSIKITRR